MFHCNGWCFSWGVAGVGATSVALRRPDPDAVWRELRAGATHMCAAPTVLIALVAHPDAAPLAHPVTCVVGGAPPSPTLIERCEALGIRLSHMYGLTESYGPGDGRRLAARRGSRLRRAPRRAERAGRADGARRRGRRVGRRRCAGAARRHDDGRGRAARQHRDGRLSRRRRGHAEAFRGGWFHSGDAAVVHADGRLELRDRFKDVIVSGGENISTIEVEQALARHPAVLDCAVVGIPDDHWGERPKAFVELRPGLEAPAGELIAFCREQLAGFKCPDSVEYCDLPRTGTGKVQKFVLREREWAGRERREQPGPARRRGLRSGGPAGGNGAMGRTRLLRLGDSRRARGRRWPGESAGHGLRGERRDRPGRAAARAAHDASARGLGGHGGGHEADRGARARARAAAAQRRRLGRRAAPARRPAKGQTLAAIQRRELTGQVAGLYVPRGARLYVLGRAAQAPGP